MKTIHHLLAGVATTVALATITACTDRSLAPTSPDAFTAAAESRESESGSGGVYTMNNSPSGNAVIAFRRAPDGSLTPLGTFATGGTGTGGTIDPLQSQYAVLLNSSHRVLFAVNAGSDQLSAFRVRADATLEDTIIEMTKKRFGMTTIVDSAGRLTGVVTDGDLRRLHLRTESIAGVRAGEVASGTPKTIGADELAAKALEVMEAWAITSLIVPDGDGRPVGVIHMHDILRAKIV